MKQKESKINFHLCDFYLQSHGIRLPWKIRKLWQIFFNIYTPSVFCYDEHKNNFDIHFSMKKHTWRMSRLLRQLFWISPCCVFKNGYFIAKTGQFWWSINIRIEFYLFVSHGGMKDRGFTCKFQKALRLCHSYLHEKQTSRIQSLNECHQSRGGKIDIDIFHFLEVICHFSINTWIEVH